MGKNSKLPSIKSWELIPFKTFGPIPIKNYCEKDLIRELGEPVHVSRPQFGDDELTFATAEGDLKALFFKNAQLISLQIPTSFAKINLDQTSLEVPAATENFLSWLNQQDPTTKNQKSMPWYSPFASKDLGVGLNPKDSKIYIYSEVAKSWLYEPDEYDPSLKEFPTDEEFVNVIDNLKDDGLFPEIKCWMPVYNNQDPAESCESLLGGFPILAQGEESPRCECCNKILVPIAQIYVDSLPQALQLQIRGRGMLQVFFCLNKDCQDLFGQPDDQGRNAYLCRFLDIKKLPLASHFPQQLKDQILPAAGIVSWEEVEDGVEIEDLKETCDPRKYSILFEDEFEEVYWSFFPTRGYKLGGLPHWEQGEEKPICPHCSPQQKKMQFILQFPGLDEKLTFGGGTLFLFQCANHPEVFVPIIQF